jgi:hypothetical protein
MQLIFSDFSLWPLSSLVLYIHAVNCEPCGDLYVATLQGSHGMFPFDGLDQNRTSALLALKR